MDDISSIIVSFLIAFIILLLKPTYDNWLKKRTQIKCLIQFLDLIKKESGLDLFKFLRDSPSNQSFIKEVLGMEISTKSEKKLPHSVKEIILYDEEYSLSLTPEKCSIISNPKPPEIQILLENRFPEIKQTETQNYVFKEKNQSNSAKQSFMIHFTANCLVKGYDFVGLKKNVWFYRLLQAYWLSGFILSILSMILLWPLWQYWIIGLVIGGLFLNKSAEKHLKSVFEKLMNHKIPLNPKKFIKVFSKISSIENKLERDKEILLNNKT